MYRHLRKGRECTSACWMRAHGQLSHNLCLRFFTLHPSATHEANVISSSPTCTPPIPSSKWDGMRGSATYLSLVTYATLEPSRGAAKPTIDGPTIDGHVDDTDRVHKPIQNQLQPPLQLERHTKPPTWRDHDYDGDRDHDTV